MPPHWSATLALAALTALVVTLMVEGLLKPRIERRNQRIKAVRAAREKVSASMLEILAAAAKLRGEGVSAGTGEQLRDRMRAEQDRWYGQMEEATKVLVDEYHTYALTYVGAGGMRSLLVRYAFTARGVVLSNRGRRRQAEILAELTDQAWTLFFGARLLRPWTWTAVARAREHLVERLDAVEAEVPAPGRP